MIEKVLLADIGGTNARFALMDRGTIGPIEHMLVADFPHAVDAIAAFLARHAAERPTAAVLGVAGPVENNRCLITNSGWLLDGPELTKLFGFASVHLLNDFEALGWSLPGLQPADLFPVGTQAPITGAPMLVLGPGTGFGAACFFKQGPQPPLVVVTEAGHATLPATSDREAQVIAELRRRFGHVSIERVLSGSGLENLYHALAGVEGVSTPERDAAAITHAALEGSCAISREALDLFCAFLGSVAGNLTLTFCARGGVYIAGGIVPRFADRLAQTRFRQQFEGKGRYDAYLGAIPTSIIVTPDTSFVGLKVFFEQNVAHARSAVRQQ